MTKEKRHYLQDLLDHLQITAASFAKSLGYDSPNKIYYILRFRNGMSVEIARDITRVYPKINYEWLLTGEGGMTKSNNAQVSLIPSNSNRQPILDIRVSAGQGIGLEGNENEVVEWVNIPKFDGCYGIMVYGDSMYDRFKSGDVVFVRPIAGRNDFDYGQCYVVITNEDRYIKNIYESSKGNEYITMTSYNTEINPDGRRKYPDKDIYINDIKHLYKVAGKLRRDQL